MLSSHPPTRNFFQDRQKNQNCIEIRKDSPCFNSTNPNTNTNTKNRRVFKKKTITRRIHHQTNSIHILGTIIETKDFSKIKWIHLKINPNNQSIKQPLYAYITLERKNKNNKEKSNKEEIKMIIEITYTHRCSPRVNHNKENQQSNQTREEKKHDWLL